LGVAKDASEQDIKKSYYQKAKQFHPDTNKGNAEAAKKFQEVQKAYETLRDPEKRRIYDQVGRENMERMESGGAAEGPGGMGGGFEGFPGGFQGFGFGNAQDIFEQLFNRDPVFGQFFGRLALQPIRISFMEAVRGTSRRVQLGQLMRGVQPPPIDVNIPAGVDNGDQVEVAINLPGKRGGTSTTRLAIPIEVEPHPVFRREGSDIAVTHDVPLVSALLGSHITVPTIEGNAEVVVPPGTQHGDKLRLRGKGVLNLRRGLKGDQYVEIRVVLPRSLTPRQKELLEEFGREEERKGGGAAGNKAGGKWW